MSRNEEKERSKEVDITGGATQVAESTNQRVNLPKIEIGDVPFIKERRVQPLLRAEPTLSWNLMPSAPKLIKKHLKTAWLEERGLGRMVVGGGESGVQ